MQTLCENLRKFGYNATLGGGIISSLMLITVECSTAFDIICPNKTHQSIMNVNESNSKIKDGKKNCH